MASGFSDTMRCSNTAVTPFLTFPIEGEGTDERLPCEGVGDFVKEKIDMGNDALSRVNTLTFDLFGTVLDLAGSLMPHIDEFLAKRESPIDAAAFWAQWRLRQRVEQYQDTILMLGHSGYLTVCKYGFIYTLRSNNIPFNHGRS